MSRRRGIVLAVAVVVGVIVWWRWVAVKDEANRAIRGSGIIEVTEVDVAFEVPGTIAERYVDEGALLDKGEPIARLDDKEYRLQVERATAAKSAADARYRLLLKGPRGQEVDQALAAVEAADSAYDTQQHEFERAKALYDRKVVSRSEFDKVSSAFSDARANA